LIGTQNRSAIYTTTDAQLATARAAQEGPSPPVVRAAAHGEITTEIRPFGTYYLTENYHQQYLSDAKNPYGYCNHGPNGMTCPIGVAKTS
jgi:peptide-methionine (S)-S-oxide reductase